MFLFGSIPLRLISRKVHPALPVRCASGNPNLAASEC